jgi:hypothetical protein
MAYPANSVYFDSSIVNNQYLDVMINRPVLGDQSDVYWKITSTYNLRPDLLAYDLYNDSKLWWIFAQRNPNTLKDPLFDFVTGVSIYIPNQTQLTTALGL